MLVDKGPRPGGRDGGVLSMQACGTTRGRAGESEEGGENVRERVVGKAAGDECRLYSSRSGLADGVSSDAMPQAAGGEGGHEAAKPHSVIHR